MNLRYNIYIDMKTFTSILEALNPEMKTNLSRKISTLGQWLYKSDGLGMMSIIDTIFKEQGYLQKIPFKQVAKFNKGLDILKKTSMNNGGYIQNQLRYRLPDGIENAQMVLINDEWDYVNKLNTNIYALSEMLAELIVRGIENNPEKGQVVYDSIMTNPKEGLLKLKPYLKRLIEVYFIERGKGLDDFKKFTNEIKISSDIGEKAEDDITKKLIENGIEILYQGGNGDFIDMIFGTDIIAYSNYLGFKTIQVKNRINWNQLGHYKVDWIAEGTTLKIYDRLTREEVEFNDNINLFDTLNEI